MKKWNYLMILGLIYCGHSKGAEGGVAIQVKESKPTSYCLYSINFPNSQYVDLLSGPQREIYNLIKDYLQTFLDFKKIFEKEVDSKNIRIAYPLETVLQKIITEEDTSQAYTFVKHFNILCLFLQACNFSFQEEYYTTSDFKIVKNFTNPLNPDRFSTGNISHMLTIHRICTLLSNFQINKDPSILHCFFSQPHYYHTFNTTLNEVLEYIEDPQAKISKKEKAKTNTVLQCSYQVNVFFFLEIGIKFLSQSVETPLLPYIHYLLKIIDIYHRQQSLDQDLNPETLISERIDRRNKMLINLQKTTTEYFSDIQKKIRDKAKYYNVVDFFNIDSNGQITLNLSPEFKKLYFQVYDLARQSDSPLSWVYHNEWTNEDFTFPLSHTIEGIIDGYHEHKEIMQRLKEGARALEETVTEDLDAIMARFGLKDNKPTPGKQTPKKKKKQPAKKSETSEASGTAPERYASAAAAAAESEEQKSAQDPRTLDSIYTYNKEYASVRLNFFPRVKEWWLTTLEKPLALDRQGYFTQGTDRSGILQRITIECQNNQNQAIQNIIFTHQLPTELVEATLQWGTVDDKTDPKVLQATAIVHVKSDIVNGYYLAEIGAKKQSDSFVSIFHSFLRKINNIQLFMSNFLTDTQNEENRLAAHESGQQEDNGSEKADDEGEWQSESGWIVTKTGPTIVISKGTTTFTLFKQ